MSFQEDRPTPGVLLPKGEDEYEINKIDGTYIKHTRYGNDRLIMSLSEDCNAPTAQQTTKNRNKVFIVSNTILSGLADVQLKHLPIFERIMVDEGHIICSHLENKLGLVIQALTGSAVGDKFFAHEDTER